MHKEDELFNQALNLDVRGFLLKDDGSHEIITCLKTVAEGGYYLTASMSATLLRRRARGNRLDSERPELHRITTAERKILRLLSDNRTSREIARQLGVSPRTIEAHRANLCSKLGLRGSNRLLQFAIEHRAAL
jgi:DNA-binding NarL/FixJ family response regulator